MSSPWSDPEPPDSESPDPAPNGRLQPVAPATLAGLAGVGLVVGYLARPLSERWWGTAPMVTWLPSLLLLFVAAVLAATARSTRRAMSGQRERPSAQHMVNRFVLARACALVGALVVGLYAGFALTWLGNGSELATQRVIRSSAAALGAAVMTLAAVLLERACRVSSEDKSP